MTKRTRYDTRSPGAARPPRRTLPLLSSLLASLAFLLASCGTAPSGGTPGTGFDLEVAGADENVTLVTGTTETVTVNLLRSATFGDPVDVTVEGLPAGVTASPLTIGAGQTSADLLLTADASADPVSSTSVTVTGSGDGFVDSDTFSLTVSDPGEGDPVDAVDAQVTAREGTGANLEDQQAVATFVLGPDEDRLYRVQVPSSDEPALYVYLNQPLNLYLYRGSGSLYATSSSSAYFGAGASGLTQDAPAAAMEPQVVAAQDCPGSCIIADNPGSGAVYVRVHNPTSVSRSYTLWAVLRGFDDENEAAFGPNDPEVFATTATGAIETFGDEDYFEVDDTGTLFIDPADASLDLVAEITDPIGSNPTRLLRPGESEDVQIGEQVRVYAENSPSRAAVSGNSQYFLSLE